MGSILLTSNGFYTETIKQEFLKVLKNKLNNDPKAVIITTASPLKENNKYAIKTMNDFIEMGIHQVDFFDVELEDASQLKQYNIIFINGGNPFNLLFYMKKSGADSVIKELSKLNTILVGASAGAVILGPNIEVVNYFTPEMNKVEMNDLTALSITNKSIFPHYDREDVFEDKSRKTIEDRLKAFENHKNFSVTRLRDDQYLLLDV